MTISAMPTTVSPEAAADAVSAESARKEPNQAKYVITSVVVATVLFFLGVGGGVWLSGGDPMGSLGVGFFTALWGGPGFGLMAGFALYNLSLERAGVAHH